jgi:citrate lyase beta subunit
MDTYFFVPATKINKVPSIKELGVDEIIIDFEDAILEEDRGKLLLEVKEIAGYRDLWYRVPVHHEADNPRLDLRLLMEFLDLDVRRFIIPKLASKGELERLSYSLKNSNDVEIILLVEHPRLLVELPQILQNVELDRLIVGVGMGSHDLMTFIGSEHTPKHFYYPRMKTLYLAKAYGKCALDIASMNISNQEAFEEEVLFGMEHGFDAKFIIHPKQYDWLSHFDALKVSKITWASRIVAALPEGFQGKDIETFVLEGQIIEKPHVEKALSILKKYKDEK